MSLKGECRTGKERTEDEDKRKWEETKYKVGDNVMCFRLPISNTFIIFTSCHLFFNPLISSATLSALSSCNTSILLHVSRLIQFLSL